MSAIDPASLARLRAALTEGPPLRLAVLFGSRATGNVRAGSDFDIGILPDDPNLPLRAELSLGSALSGAVGAEVDVVRLDEDNPLLGREIARSGICLFEAHPGMFAAYRAQAMSRWIDFDETISPHRERFLRRLAGARESNVDLVTRKLAGWEEHLRRLRERRPNRLELFIGDSLLQGGCIERFGGRTGSYGHRASHRER